MVFAVAGYFKRIKVKGTHHLRVKGPVIIAMNHPNSFADPIAFTTVIYPPRIFYLARGDAFKKGIVTVLLESLGIIPIFRIQDAGKEGLKKNDETYERVNTLLKRNKKIIIFAEGLCIQERRLRPLKKGVPRMLFGAMEEHDLKDLIVIPVGANYSKPADFRSNLFYNIGAPIKVQDYMDAYRQSPAKTMNQFIADLYPKMKELIVHINDIQSETVIAHLEEIYQYDFFKSRKLKRHDPEHQFMLSTSITEVINNVQKDQPEKITRLQEKTSAYMNTLEKEKIKDWLMIPEKQSSVNYLYLSARIVFIILSIPVYLRGIAGNIIPYLITDSFVNKKVRILEFKTSFRLGVGALLFLIFYIAQFFIAKALAPNAWWALLVITVSALTGYACLYLSPFRKKTKGIYRMLKIRSSQPQLVTSLAAQRQEILRLYKELM